ncbi:MAG TPA: hypothetical protein VNN80_22810, partial [Polyangiaceae bacterium]|nr:hypothetical protein [Polyangiaceae bacterium]
CDLGRFKELLGLMFNPPPPKKQDPLTQYSLPDTGSFWFAPALGDLNLALREPALNSVIQQGNLPDNLKAFNDEWIPAWPAVIARAWSDDDFRQRLQKEPRKTAAGELELPLFDAELVVKEGINRGTFVFALIDDIPLPTSQWQEQWPGIIAEIRRNPALKAEFLGDTQAFCERRHLPFLEHILLAVDENADRHKVIMPIPDPGQEIADYVRPVLSQVVQSNPPCYASSSCC